MIRGEILVEPIAVLVIIAVIKSNTSMKMIDFPNFAMFRHIPLYFGDFLLSFGMVRKTTESTEGHREKKQCSSVLSVVNFLCHESFHPEYIKKSHISLYSQEPNI